MPTDAPASQPEQKCEKCGQPAELLSFVARFGERPAFRIFDCPACGALTWVAEGDTGSEPQE
jgi:hypothetical protein